MSTSINGAARRPGRRRPIWQVAAIVVVGALIAVGCGGGDGATPSTGSQASSGTTVGTGGDPLTPRPLAERRTVRFGTPFAGIESFSQLPLAAFLGELEKENLDFKLEVVPFAEGVLLLERGDIDVYPYSLSPVLFNAIAGGSSIRLITSTAAFPEASKTGYWVRPEFANDFANCKFDGVAWSAGGSAGLTGVGALPLAEHLREKCGGKTFRDLTPPSLVGGADLLVALESGAVQFGFLTEPFWVTAQDAGLAQFTLPFPRDVHTAGYAMSRERNEEPEFTDAILRALLRTTQGALQGDYHADPKVRQFLVDELKLKPEVLDTIPALTFDPALNFRDDAVVPLQEVWLESGDFLTYDKPLTFDQVFDRGPLKRVLG